MSTWAHALHNYYSFRKSIFSGIVTISSNVDVAYYTLGSSLSIATYRQIAGTWSGLVSVT